MSIDFAPVIDIVHQAHPPVSRVPNSFTQKIRRVLDKIITGGTLAVASAGMLNSDEASVAHKSATRSMETQYGDVFPAEAPEMERIDLLKTKHAVKIGDSTIQLFHHMVTAPDVQIGEHRYSISGESGISLKPFFMTAHMSDEKIVATMGDEQHSIWIKDLQTVLAKVQTSTEERQKISIHTMSITKPGETKTIEFFLQKQKANE